MQMPQQFTRNTRTMNTPTPRTDKKKFISRGTSSYPTLPKEVVLASDSETLERELMAMTEQRDEAWKEIDLLKTNLRIQNEHTENAVQDRADEHIELHNQIHELTEALKEIYNVSAFDYDSMPESARRKYREVVSEMADVALQSLNQPEP